MTACCLTQPITLRRGDDYPPKVWGFGPEDAPEIPLGARFRLEVEWYDLRASRFSSEPAGSFTATSEPPNGLAVNYLTGTVTWTYTSEQSAGFPPTAKASYVLRCIVNGKTETWADGPIHLDGCGC